MIIVIIVSKLQNSNNKLRFFKKTLYKKIKTTKM